MTSLIDPSLPPPFVPASVFTGVQSTYWSASTFAGNPTDAWKVAFFDGLLGTGHKDGTDPAWCVRGGRQESVY